MGGFAPTLLMYAAQMKLKESGGSFLMDQEKQEIKKDVKRTI